MHSTSISSLVTHSYANLKSGASKKVAQRLSHRGRREQVDYAAARFAAVLEALSNVTAAVVSFHSAHWFFKKEITMSVPRQELLNAYKEVRKQENLREQLLTFVQGKHFSD